MNLPLLASLSLLLASPAQKQIIDHEALKNAQVIEGISSDKIVPPDASKAPRNMGPMSGKDASTVLAHLQKQGAIKFLKTIIGPPTTLDLHTMSSYSSDPAIWYGGMSIGFYQPYGAGEGFVTMGGLATLRSGVVIGIAARNNIPMVMIETTMLMSVPTATFTLYREDRGGEVAIGTATASGSPARVVFLLSRPGALGPAPTWGTRLVMRADDPNFGYIYGSTSFRTLTEGK